MQILLYIKGVAHQPAHPCHQKNHVDLNSCLILAFGSHVLQ
jgi:hypothetical protein